MATDTDLPRGIHRRADGSFTARKFIDGKRRQKTFAVLEDAIQWHMGAGNDVESLPTGIMWWADRSQYVARVTVQGKRKAAYFDTLDEAVSWREAALAAAAKGLPLPAVDTKAPVESSAGVELFGEAVRAWHADHVSEGRRRGRLLPRTIKMHEYKIDTFILPRLGHLPLAEITPAHIRDFRDYYAGFEPGGQSPRLDSKGTPVKGYSADYVGAMLWIVESTFKYAQAQGWTRTNPAYGISSVKPSSPIVVPHTPVYVDASSAIALARLLHPNLRLGMWLGRLCGLRVGEVFGLRLMDVDLEGRFLRIRAQAGKKYESWDEDGNIVVTNSVERTKTPAGTRIVGIPQILMPLVRAAAQDNRRNPNPDDPLLVTPKGGRHAGSLVVATGREAARLGLWEKDGDPASPHDMRKSFATDLEIIGVSPYLRSIIMGHRTNTSVEGGAVITSSVYTLANPHIQRIVAAADQLGEWFTEQTGINDLSTLDDGEKEWVASWMRIEEAGQLLGVGADTIKLYARNGELTFRKHKHPNQNTPSIWVARAEVERLAEDKANRITIAQAVSDLGLSDAIIVKIARDNDIPIHRDRIKMQRAYFDPEGFKQLRYLVGLRDEFLEANMTMQVASELLQVKDSTVAGMITRGILDEAVPLAKFSFQGSPRWVTRSSVDKALETPNFWRKKQPSQRSYSALRDMVDPNALTVAEAGTLLGRSSDWVRRLVKAGQLEPAPGQKRGQGITVRVTRASVEKYATDNGIRLP